MLVVLSAIVMLGGVLVFVAIRTRAGDAAPVAPGDTAAVESLAVELRSFRGDTLRRNELFGPLLSRLGVEPERVEQAQGALELAGFDFRRLHPGDSVTLTYLDSVLVGIRYYLDLATSYDVEFDSAGAQAAFVMQPVDTARAVLFGTVKGSLWQSMTNAGADPHLVVDFTDVLRNQVEFPAGTSEGDSFQVLVEQLAVDSAFYRFGDILAARYRSATVDARGFLYRKSGGGSFYCDEHGRALGKSLEYPPIQAGRRTSDFGMRMHPILRRRRMHQGMDYAAPYRTPVRAIAGGTVTVRKWSGGYGRMVRVRHKDGTTTSHYAHLCGYGPGVRKDGTVSKGQIVGYVGSTGFSTGFHLDFGIRRNGKPVDPLEFLPSHYEQVPAERMSEFGLFIAGYRAGIRQAMEVGPELTQK